MTENASPRHSDDGQRDQAPLDHLFVTLSKPPRRRILTALADTTPSADAEFSPMDFVSEEHGDAAVTKLHHAHLPKLDEVDFIEWDPESATITHGSRFAEVEPVVELLAGHRDELPGEWP